MPQSRSKAPIGGATLVLLRGVAWRMNVPFETTFLSELCAISALAVAATVSVHRVFSPWAIFFASATLIAFVWPSASAVLLAVAGISSFFWGALIGVFFRAPTVPEADGKPG